MGTKRVIKKAWLFVSLVCLTSPLVAQYRAAGSGLDLQINEQEFFEQRTEESRWKWGPFHVDPVLALGDIRYRDNVVDQEGNLTEDITGSVYAGLKAYLPFRDNAVVAAHAIPGYRFWLDLDERNDTVEKYGLGLFGFQNRFRYELSGRRDKDQRFPTSELLQQVNETRDRFRGAVQFRIAGAFALTGGGQLDKLRYGLPGDLSEEDAAQLGLLDRDETRFRLGLRYLLRGSDGWIGLGAERAENEFTEAAELRSNEGDNFFLELRLRGNKVAIDADLVQNDLQATQDGSFPGFNGPTGSALVLFRASHSIHPKIYWRSDLRYSIIGTLTAFIEQRGGIALDWYFRNRGAVQVFYENGENDYTETGGNIVEDTEGYGLVITARLIRSGNLRIGYRRTEFQSSDGQRQLEEIIASFSLGDISSW